MTKPPGYITVIGTSAGGLDALLELVRNLPGDADTAYCVVLHLSRKAIGDFVLHRISQVSSMHSSLAKHGEVIKRNHIYIAKPDHHLLVKDKHFVLGSGPEENRFRPSIDVLFRSAAVAYNSHAIGIILTGMLDDGTSGMAAIKKCGGTCIVQDPNQAEYPDMPLSVINNMEADHVVSLEAIGALIEKISKQKRKKKNVPKDLIAESKIAETMAVGINIVEQIGIISPLACPDCGGNLWAIKDNTISRYRCHIGHAYSERDLVLKQAEKASETLWVALRMMEERTHLLKKLETENTKKGYKKIAETQAEKQQEISRHINTLKKILEEVQNGKTPS